MNKEPLLISKEEMAKFILAQPDGKRVDMMETESKNKCGCLMVQFGRSIGLDFSYCGRLTFYKEENEGEKTVETEVAKLHGFSFNHFCTGRTDRVKFFEDLKPKAREVLDKAKVLA